MEFLVDTAERLREEWAAIVASRAPIALDFETSGPTIRWQGKSRPDPYRHRITGFSLAHRDRCFYVPVRHVGTDGEEPGSDCMAVPWKNVPVLLMRAVLSELTDQARAGRIVWAHTLGYEVQMLINEGLLEPHQELPAGFRCSELATWLGWTITGKDLGLKRLRQSLLGKPARPDFKDTFGGRDVCDVRPRDTAEYAALDAADCLELGGKAWARLEEQNLVEHYLTLDLPLIEITRGMAAAGMGRKESELRQLMAECELKRDEAARRFQELTTTEVTIPLTQDVPVRDAAGNVVTYKSGKRAGEIKTRKERVPTKVRMGAEVGSDGQVSRWLYDELKWWPVPEEWDPRSETFRTVDRNDKDLYSVASEYVSKFTALPDPAGEAARLRLQYQKYDKLVGTYCLPILELPSQYGDGRVHPTLKVVGTQTQRFSGSGPNFQNLPARSEEGQRLQECLVAPYPGWRIVAYDESQIELRLQADIAKDGPWLAAYEFGIDVHQQTATALGVPRRTGKEVNLSVIYGVMEDTLAARIDQPGVDRNVARGYIDGFYRKHPAIVDYQGQAEKFATERGYIRTRDGFKRFGLKARWRRKEGRNALSPGDARKASNTPVQGGAGGIMKAAMIDLWRRWVAAGVYGEAGGVVLLNQVHDSLVVACRPDREEMVHADMKEIMTQPRFGWTVPLVVEGGSGDTIGAAK